MIISCGTPEIIKELWALKVGLHQFALGGVNWGDIIRTAILRTECLSNVRFASLSAKPLIILWSFQFVANDSKSVAGSRI